MRGNAVWRSLPVVVVASKDLTADERAPLTGKVERILQKGAYSRDELLREVRAIVSECVRTWGRAGTAPGGQLRGAGQGERGGTIH